MTTEVIITADFETWWDGLAIEEQKSVAVVVAMLEERGPTLPFPYSSGITGSPKLRELRIQHAGKPYRILYAFDPKRNATCCWEARKRVPPAGMKSMSRRRRSC